jgi:hypothetical protein
MQISKKTLLMYNPNTFMANPHIEIRFELPYTKQSTYQKISLELFRDVKNVIFCVMDGVNEVNKI